LVSSLYLVADVVAAHLCPFNAAGRAMVADAAARSAAVPVDLLFVTAQTSRVEENFSALFCQVVFQALHRLIEMGRRVDPGCRCHRILWRISD
jgi:hypothetical protein